MTSYKVTHVTRYEYELPVLHARHLAHVRPRFGRTQRLLEFGWKAQPAPAWHAPAADYFGNPTDAFEINEVHDLFELKVESRLELDPPKEELGFAREIPWDVWAARLARDPEFYRMREFTFDSPLVRLESGLYGYVSPLFPDGRPAIDAVKELCHRIHEDLTYDPTVTDATTPLAQVLSSRRGVCQDFAHFGIGCLRALGLPTRYVSGYLETKPPPGRPRLRGADASHAWLSVFLPEVGWTDFDPTNDMVVTDRHITLGWGRDFSDVSPLKGVVLGGGSHRVVVEVDVEPVEG